MGFVNPGLIFITVSDYLQSWIEKHRDYHIHPRHSTQDIFIPVQWLWWRPRGHTECMRVCTRCRLGIQWTRILLGEMVSARNWDSESLLTQAEDLGSRKGGIKIQPEWWLWNLTHFTVQDKGSHENKSYWTQENNGCDDSYGFEHLQTSISWSMPHSSYDETDTHEFQLLEKLQFGTRSGSEVITGSYRGLTPIRNPVPIMATIVPMT